MDLRELLGCKVDIVTEKGLNDDFRDEVLREARPLTRNSTSVKGKKSADAGYGESIFWIKLVPKGNYVAVRIGSMKFTASGKLLSKLLLSGALYKGTHMTTDERAIIKSQAPNR